MEIIHSTKVGHPGFFDDDEVLFKAEWDGRSAQQVVSKKVLNDFGEEYSRWIWHRLDIAVAKPPRI